ncbi:MAG: putative DNA-directed polymerase, omega subunit [Firmicutes bacterium]|nr:putative DNA-directed polymerase, omega subunit [Bacillota bacterium]
MRPLKLIMTAFGPYAKEQLIDFTELGGRNLFLITGPTGAGKTTIFDGICFAIYGKASGQDRDSQSMRSHFADDGLITAVELEFELRGKRYRVRREPKQLKKKSRGEGYTDYGPEAEFKVLDDEAAVSLSGVRDVDEKVIEILGMNYEQFRQIIMVPQGEFRELLTTESKEREGILQKIFGTEGFRLIQDKLGEKAKMLEQEVRTLKIQQEQIIHSIDSTRHLELAEVITKTSDIRIVAEELEKSLVVDGKETEALQEAIDKSELLAVSKQQEIFQAKETNRKIAARDDAELTKNKLEGQAAEIEGKKVRLREARQAVGIKGIEDNCHNWSAQVEKKTEFLSIVINREAEASKVMETAAQKYNQEAAKEVERNALLTEQARLQGFKDKITDFETKAAEVIVAEKKLDDVREKLTKAKGELEQTKGDIKNKQQALDQAKFAATEYVRQTAQMEKVNAVYDKLEKLKEANNRLESFRQSFARFHREVEERKGAWEARQLEYDQAQTLFYQGQASVLAEKLRVGEPCPVCGGCDHPKPAGKIHGVLSDAELKTLGEQLTAAKDKYETCKSKYDEVKAGGYAEKQIVGRLQAELAELVKDDLAALEKEKLTKYIADKMEEVRQQIKGLNCVLEGLAKQKSQESILVSSLESKQQLAEGLEKTIEGLQNEHMALYAKVESDRGLLKGLEAELPAEIRSQQVLESAIDKIKIEYQQMKKALEQAEAYYRSSQVNQAKIMAEKESAIKVLNEAKQELTGINAKFSQAIADAGFSGEADYVKAKLAEAAMVALEKEISDYLEILRSARDNYIKLEREVTGLSLVKLEPLELELGSIQEGKNKFIQQCSEIIARQKHNKTMLDGICELGVKLDQAEAQYLVLGELANVAKGNNNQKVSFERYVLAAFFNDIIEAANLRLSKMSAGRYQMRRMTEKGKGTAQSGLELEVFDYYTGRARHVKTLSGGESFKASLALALGLADVVQAYAGGISLETMFVDEGFGTLDPESLDSAIACLVELQHSGRLVGIISHVPELKDSVDARLEIEAGKAGSRATFWIA